MSGLCLSACSLSTRPLQWGGGARHRWVLQRTCRTRNIRVRRAGIPKARFDSSRITGFFTNSRSESRLYASVLTKLIYTYSSQIPAVLVYALLNIQSQNVYKLRVFCRVLKRHYIYRLIKPASGLYARQIGTRRMIFKFKFLFFVDPTRFACVPRAERKRNA
jgi:hypothetical protein